MSNFFKDIHHQLRNGAFVYTLGSLFRAGIQIFANIIMLAYVDPHDLGIWNSLLLIQTYSMFLGFGILNGFGREFPFLLGKNKKNEAIKYAESALFQTVLAIVVVILIGIVIAIKTDNGYIFNISLVAVIFTTAFKFYENYLTATFRSSQSFKALGYALIVRGFLGAITIPIVVYFSYEGFVLRAALTAFLMMGLLHFIKPIKVRIKFNKDQYINMLKFGVFSLTIGYIYQVSNTSDRVFLLKYGNTDLVGYYSIALMVYSSINILPTTIVNYIYPKLSYTVGKKSFLQPLWGKIVKINLLLVVSMFLIAIIGYYLLPFFINNFFVKYTPGVRAAQILLFASVFFAGSIGSNLLWSLKAYKYMAIAKVSGAIFNVLFVFLGIKVINDPLVGASLGILVSQFSYFILSNVLTYIKTHE